MTEYVLTYMGEVGEHVRSLSVALGNDEQARQFASRTAQRCHSVTLTAVDEDGAVATMARWLNGALTRNANGVSPVIIEGEFVDTETEDEVSEEEAITDIADDEHDDEAHHFEGRCMKCKVNREYIGRVVELSNGSKAAKGSCPVCGTTITRMVARSTPLDDDWDEPAQPPETDETETEVSEPIGKELADDISAQDEPPAVPQAEFSNAPTSTPAKKANTRQRTPNQEAAANPTKGHCPKCDQTVDVIERAGIRIFTAHGDEAKGLDRCPGSTTVVQG